MRLLVVNPNTSASMTAAHRRGRARRRGAGDGDRRGQSRERPGLDRGLFRRSLRRARAWSRKSSKGEAAGSTRSSSPVSTTPAWRRRAAAARGPVIGIGEAAFHLASLIAHRFSVVTTLSRSIAPIEANLMKYGLDRRVRARARLRGSGAGARGSRPRARARNCRRRSSAPWPRTAPRRSCSAAPAWRNSPPRWRADHGLPVIDGVAAAVKLAEALVALGLATSKRGPYARAAAQAVRGRVRGARATDLRSL